MKVYDATRATPKRARELLQLGYIAIGFALPNGEWSTEGGPYREGERIVVLFSNRGKITRHPAIVEKCPYRRPFGKPAYIAVFEPKKYGRDPAKRGTKRRKPRREMEERILRAEERLKALLKKRSPIRRAKLTEEQLETLQKRLERAKREQDEMLLEKKYGRDPAKDERYEVHMISAHVIRRITGFSTKSRADRYAKNLRSALPAGSTTVYSVYDTVTGKVERFARAPRRPRTSRDFSNELRHLSLQALGRLLRQAIRQGDEAKAHLIEKEIDRRARAR